MTNTVIHGDCLEVLKGMADNSVDSIVTDPPYGLSFMGKKWDYDVPSEEIWRECLRVLKDGGHLLAFAGTRTQHRMAVRIEDAGFEIRDMIAWVYGSGFPKSHNIGKAVDKLQGNEREVVGEKRAGKTAMGQNSGWNAHENKTVMEATKGTSEWEGWGTALKPALEPITVARKPFKGAVAENVLKHGTGAINVDGCRVEVDPNDPNIIHTESRGGTATKFTGTAYNNGKAGGELGRGPTLQHPAGRWPANLIHDGSDEVVGLFPETKPSKSTQHAGNPSSTKFGQIKTSARITAHEDNGGSAARFFYQAKASRAERNAGLEGFEVKDARVTGMQIDPGMPMRMENGVATGPKAPPVKSANHHPTVKPIALMRYLVRLVTPPNGIVLDPFGGSGSTACGAVMEGMRFVTIEREADYIPIIEARVAHWTAEAEAEAKEKKKADNQLSLF
jgi:site-specific DNA-methyltransferase (adenine-specific)